jgi:plasmid stability protein
MPDLLIDVPDEIARALEVRAKKNGRTPEEEHRAILEQAYGPYDRSEQNAVQKR